LQRMSFPFQLTPSKLNITFISHLGLTGVVGVSAETGPF
jgi:hypothetical protein